MSSRRRRAAIALLALLSATCSAAGASASWPERSVVREGLTVSSQVVSEQALYALVSQTHTPIRGPYLLQRTDLRTGVVRRGPRFSLGGLTFAAGHLWVYGASGSLLHVIEIDPRTLTPVRSFRFRALGAYPGLAVATGSDGSAWLGTWRTLLQVDAASGAVLARITLPPRLAVVGVAVDPTYHYLYISSAHVVKGGVEGNTVLEYAARSGRKLAGTAGGLISESVVGAALTAVPGGVWATFRTGLLGLTIHLRRKDLAMIAPPGPGIALRPATSVFHWPMNATSLYGGGALWLANDAGIVACLDPERGKVRAEEHVPPSRLIDLLAVDPASHVVFALEGRRLVRIVPPQRCWR